MYLVANEISGPVVALGARVMAYIAVVFVAGHGQEDGVAGSGAVFDPKAVGAAVYGGGEGAFLLELFVFLQRGGAPCATHAACGGIVGWLELYEVVKTVVLEGYVAVFTNNSFIITIMYKDSVVFVCRIISIIMFGFDFSLCVVNAVLVGAAGSDVAVCPLDAETEVYGFGSLSSGW